MWGAGGWSALLGKGLCASIWQGTCSSACRSYLLGIISHSLQKGEQSNGVGVCVVTFGAGGKQWGASAAPTSMPSR